MTIGLVNWSEFFEPPPASRPSSAPSRQGGESSRPIRQTGGVQGEHGLVFTGLAWSFRGLFSRTFLAFADKIVEGFMLLLTKIAGQTTRGLDDFLAVLVRQIPYRDAQAKNHQGMPRQEPHETSALRRGGGNRCRTRRRHAAMFRHVGHHVPRLLHHFVAGTRRTHRMMGMISRIRCMMSVMSMVGVISRGFGGCSVYMCHFFLLNLHIFRLTAKRPTNKSQEPRDSNSAV